MLSATCRTVVESALSSCVLPLSKIFYSMCVSDIQWSGGARAGVNALNPLLSMVESVGSGKVEFKISSVPMMTPGAIILTPR